MTESEVLRFAIDAQSDATKALVSNDDIGYWSAQGRISAYRHIAYLLHEEEQSR